MPKTKSPPKCSLCKLPGHTKSKCPTLTTSSQDEKSPDFNPATTLKKITKAEQKVAEEIINNPVKTAEEILAEKKKFLLAQMEELENEEKVLQDKKDEELKKQHALRVEKYNEEYKEKMLNFFKDQFNQDLATTPNNLAYETYRHFVKHAPPVMGQEKKSPGAKPKSGGKIKTDFSCKKQKNYNPEKHGVDKLTDTGCKCLRVYSDGNYYNILGWCNKKAGGGVCARHTKNPDEITTEHKQYLLHGDHQYTQQNKDFYDKM